MKYLVVTILFIFQCTSMLFAQDNLQKVSIQLQWKHQFEFAGFYIAQEKGFYQDVGLDVEIKEYAHNTNIVNDVLKETSTFGTNYPSLILEKSKGKEIVLLSSILQSSPHALVTLESSNIKSIKDFKGKSIMIGKDAAIAAPFVSMLQSNQLTFDDLIQVPHTFNVDDLINKNVDISTIFRTNEAFYLDQKNIKYTIWDPKDYGFDFYDVLVFTSSKQVKQNPEMVKNFNEASLKGWEYAFDNIEESVELILQKYNTQNKSKEALLFEAKELKKLAYYKTDELGRIDANTIQRIFDIYNILGLTQNQFNLDEFIFNKKSFYTKEEQSFTKDKHFNVYVNNWLPFASYNNEEALFEGLAIDYWKRISKHASINSNIVHTNSFLELLNKSKSDKNAITLSLSYTEDRSKYGSFTKPYVSFPVAIATSIKEDYIVDLEHLEGRRVAVGKNFSAHKLLKKHYPNIQFVPVKNTTEALSLLANGKVFAAADILPTLSYYLNKYAYSNLKISGTSEFKFEVRMMVNQANESLTPILNKAIDSMTTHEKKLINNKWLQYKTSIEKINYTLLAMILIPIAMLTIFIFILYYNQRKYIKALEKKEQRIEEQTLELKKGQEVLSQYVLYSRTNLKGIITDVSEAFCILSGYTKEELIGKPHNICRHPKNNADKFKELWRTIEKGSIWSGEVRNMKKDGSDYWIASTISTEYDSTGKAIGYVSIKTDITARKEFEKQHEQLIEQAKMASLGEMIGNIAHQWRQPLNLITVATTGIQIHQQMKTLDDKTMKEFSDSILTQANYLSRTIDTFKNFIKKENSTQSIVLQEELEHAFGIVESALKNNFVSLKTEIPKEPISIVTNQGELTQVFINIINNAKDVLIHREIENPTITIKLKQLKHHITISIEDNAGGIKEEVLPHIFEPYFTTKHKSQGTGLGLYMSYQLITESLHGNLNVQNSENGALFTIMLPLNDKKTEDL